MTVVCIHVSGRNIQLGGLFRIFHRQSYSTGLEMEDAIKCTHIRRPLIRLLSLVKHQPFAREICGIVEVSYSNVSFGNLPDEGARSAGATDIFMQMQISLFLHQQRGTMAVEFVLAGIAHRNCRD